LGFGGTPESGTAGRAAVLLFQRLRSHHGNHAATIAAATVPAAMIRAGATAVSIFESEAMLP
jgi:hypothetical protein